jgi:cytochrome c-type biogenesis protein CcmE
LNSLKNNILYFKTPSEVRAQGDLKFDKLMRIGGMVKKNSVLTNGKEIKFIITDFENEIFVTFSGTVPNLFSEEKGVVAEGKLRDKNFFVAQRILAKHDEEYMPVELNDIKKSNAK